MKTPGIVCVAALLATTAIAGTPPEPGSEAEIELRVAVFDVCGVGADTTRVAVAHAGWLLRRSGVRLAARQVRPGEGIAADDVHLLVVLNASPLRDARRRRVAGEVDRQVSRAIWVHPPEIESLPVSVLPLSRELRLRELLGVAIAHELLHLLADAQHAGHGVMAQGLRARTSLRDTWIDPGLFPRLRAGVARLESGLTSVNPPPDAVAALAQPPASLGAPR